MRNSHVKNARSFIVCPVFKSINKTKFLLLFQNNVELEHFITYSNVRIPRRDSDFKQVPKVEIYVSYIWGFIMGNETQPLCTHVHLTEDLQDRLEVLVWC